MESEGIYHLFWAVLAFVEATADPFASLRDDTSMGEVGADETSMGGWQDDRSMAWGLCIHAVKCAAVVGGFVLVPVTAEVDPGWVEGFDQGSLE